jgi:hypothetical protein
LETRAWEARAASVGKEELWMYERARERVRQRTIVAEKERDRERAWQRKGLVGKDYRSLFEPEGRRTEVATWI